MKKWLKRIGLTLLILIVLLVGIGWAITYFYKDKIIDAVVDQSNQHITGRLDVEDASISLFKAFPSIQIRLDDVVVEGPDYKGSRDTLASIENLYLKAPLKNLWAKNGQYSVEEVLLAQPTVRAITYDETYQNWNITKPSEGSTESTSSTQVDLEKIKIENGDIVYMDATTGTAFQALGLDHVSSGSFGSEKYVLKSQTNAKSVSFKADKNSYLNQLPLNANLDVAVDQKNGTYQIDEGTMTLGKYPISVTGNVAEQNAAYVMDLALSSMGSSLLDLMAVSPYLKQSVAEQIDAKGDLSLEGTVKGLLNLAKNDYPAMRVALKMNDGSFKVDEFPERIEKLFADIILNKTQGDWDKLSVKAKKLDFELDDNPFTTSFNADHLLTDVHADGHAKGTLDFEKLNHIFSFEEMGVKKGVLDVDVTFDVKQSYIDNNEYDKVDAQGYVKGKDIKYVYNDQNIYVDNVDVDVNKKAIEIKKLEGNLDENAYKMSGKVTDPLHILSDNKKWNADFYLDFDKINTNAFMTSDETNAPDVQQKMPSYLKNGTVLVNARVNELKYQDFDFKDVKTKATYTFDQLKLEKTQAQLFEDTYKTNGRIENIAGYVYENRALGGHLEAQANTIHVDNFLSEENPEIKTTPQESQPFSVPERINLTINTKSPVVYYDNMELNNLTGKVVFDNGRVRFQDVITQLLDGELHTSGAYQLLDSGEPKLDLNTKIKKMSFSKAFETFNTWKILMPIGKYIDGKFNTEFDMSSKLDQSYIPQLESISLDGIMQTLDGVVREWSPLMKLNEKLKLDLFDNISIENTWNKIHIENGRISVDPFEKNIKGVDMTISGSHGIDQQMDYKILAIIPKEMLDKAGWSKVTSGALADINKQFGKYNLNEINIDKIPVNIHMTGSMSDPDISFKVEKPDAKDLVNNIKDAAKKEVNSKINTAKDEVKKSTNAVKDTVKKEINKEIDKILTGKSDTTSSDPKKNVEDAAKKELDKVKDKIGKWNPFKKGN